MVALLYASTALGVALLTLCLLWVRHILRQANFPFPAAVWVIWGVLVVVGLALDYALRMRPEILKYRRAKNGAFFVKEDVLESISRQQMHWEGGIRTLFRRRELVDAYYANEFHFEQHPTYISRPRYGAFREDNFLDFCGMEREFYYHSKGDRFLLVFYEDEPSAPALIYNLKFYHYSRGK